MSDRGSEDGDGLDFDRDPDDLPGSNGTDGGDDPGVLGGDEGGEWPGRDFDPGPGLTEPERELADELERIRELERARDRVGRLTGSGEVGYGGGGSSPEDRDALAIIDAAGRFGLEVSEKDEEERQLVKQALADFAALPPKKVNEYTFLAIVEKQATAGRKLVLSLAVPWECRDEVFRSLETMPFSCKVTLSECAEVD
ncbi:MAG: hypothetical protein OK436_04185 [Thaumarchaeota archaeon]|nr:hypothetical protein [Nitrososphaerota archaeon]